MLVINPLASEEHKLITHKGRKGKKKYLYSAIYTTHIVSKFSDMDHTVLPANYTMPACPS